MKLEEHIENSEKKEEEQVGFSERGRIVNNLLILMYCVEMSYRIKKPLIVISMDFSKAYDSV